MEREKWVERPGKGIKRGIKEERNRRKTKG